MIPKPFDPRSSIAIDREAAGVPDDTQQVPDFGRVLAAGDITGDGRSDLVVAAPKWGCVTCDGYQYLGKGAIVLLQGSTTGLTTSGSQFWNQESPGVAGVADATGDAFGSALAVGPLDRDGYADVAIGAPGDAVGDRGRGGGSVTILRGHSTGLSTAGVGGQRYSQDSAGVAGKVEGGDDFGAAVSASVVQRPTQASLIVGAPFEGVDPLPAAGQITQLSAGKAGPTGTGSRTFHQDSPGVKGVLSELANLGAELS